MHGADTDNTQGTRIHLAPDLCHSLPTVPSVLASTPLILAIVDRLAADPAPRKKSLSGSEERLVAVLRDELSRARSTPILLPMPQDTNLRKIAEQ